MSVLPQTTRALALLAEAEALLGEALIIEREYGDPQERDIRTTRDRTFEARRAAQAMFQEDC